MNIYIRIEVLSRELQGRLLLALVAAERGHRVILGKLNRASILGSKTEAGYPPGIFHDKSLGHSDPKTEMKKVLYSRGWGLTAQDEEHGLSTTVFAENMLDRFPAEGFERNHLLFAWGEFDGRALRDLHPGYSDRIITTGSPRVDFWRPEFQSVHSADNIFSETHGQPFVLFAPAGPISPQRNGRSSSPATEPSFVTQSPSNERRFRRSALEVQAAKTIAEGDPSRLLIVRPHPAQSLEDWRYAFQDSPTNLRLVRDVRASPWVHHADAVVTNGSTLAMEAFLANVPHINFAPEGLYVFGAAESGFTHGLGRDCTGIDELVNLLKSAVRPDTRRLWYSNEATLRVRDRLHALDGRLAADRIVDAWERLGRDLALDDAKPWVQIDARAGGPRGARSEKFLTFAAQVRRRTRLRNSSAIATPDPAKAVYLEKFPAIDFAALDLLHDDLSAASGRFGDVRRVWINDRLAMFERE